MLAKGIVILPPIDSPLKILSASSRLFAFMDNEKLLPATKPPGVISPPNFELSEKDVHESPFKQFEVWWNDAVLAEVYEYNAMTLATGTADGMIDARTVLLKGFDDTGFVFYTNYNSAKGNQLAKNSQCCLLFFWKELERQVKIKGIAQKISLEESIAYFDSRPDGSKIGAWSSPQSMVVAGKAWLTETYQYYAERFKHGQIPKPPHWGGFRVLPTQIEFWQGRPSRMHDRLLYTQQANFNWIIERLAP